MVCMMSPRIHLQNLSCIKLLKLYMKKKQFCQFELVFVCNAISRVCVAAVGTYVRFCKEMLIVPRSGSDGSSACEVCRGSKRGTVL
jgi:hypothetical protein